MKIMSILLCLLPMGVFAIEPGRLTQKLEAAATAEGGAYIEARMDITVLGTDVLPDLARAAEDSALTWQQRLVARICHERISMEKSIARLRNHDWRQHPGFDPDWELNMTGPGWKMQSLAVSHLVEVGLWYYYIENTWKQIGEMAISPLRDINDYWPRWCRMALARRPEEEYLFRAMAERLDKDERLGAADGVKLYKEILNAKWADAVPVLVERYEAYNRREVIGPELFEGRHAQLYRGMFQPILAMSDARHVDLLESFMARRLALFELLPNISEIRTRTADVPKADPPFCLRADN